MYTGYRYGYGYGEPERTFSFQTIRMEQYIAGLGRPNSSLAPRTYFAILAENPDVELGVEDTSPRDDLHIVVGAY
jgi:hypothetical protein